MEIKIVATTGRASGQSVDIRAAKFFIGRHENCQLRPDIADLAGIHALIEQRDFRVYLRDFGVEGGTGINDRVLHAREAEVFDGDLIQIGPMVLTLSIKPKGEGPTSLVQAPEGWPYLAELAEPAPSRREASVPPPPHAQPRVEPRLTAAVLPLAASSTATATAPEHAAHAPAHSLPLPIGARPAGHHRALTCRTIDGVLVASIVSPDLNEEETVSPFRYELRSLLDEEQTPDRMVIDLGNTRYLSSRAVGVILAHYQGLDRKGASMRVCGVSREIRPVLDQMRLSMLIDIFPTVEDAVQTAWD